MDFDGSDFEPINNDFSSNYNRSGGSSSNAKPVALNVRARNNVVPFPLISERKFGSTGVSDKQLNGAPVPDSGDDLWARDVFVFCQNGSTGTVDPWPAVRQHAILDDFEPMSFDAAVGGAVRRR